MPKSSSFPTGARNSWSSSCEGQRSQTFAPASGAAPGGQDPGRLAVAQSVWRPDHSGTLHHRAQEPPFPAGLFCQPARFARCRRRRIPAPAERKDPVSADLIHLGYEVGSRRRKQTAAWGNTCDCPRCRGVKTADRKWGFDHALVPKVHCIYCRRKIGRRKYVLSTGLARFGIMEFAHIVCARKDPRFASHQKRKGSA